jgi:class 3 adenylate cyclase
MSDATAATHLSSYVPVYLRRLLADRHKAPDAPWASKLPCAILFADVSGFTRLSIELARQGPIGAEKLSLALNTYFGQFIDILARYGGDVLRFAGDAPLVLFAADDERGIDEAFHRAAASALALQEVLHRYEVAPELHLSMRIHLTAGIALAAIVGGVNQRWEFLVGGAPLDALRALAPLGDPGEVLTSTELWPRLEPHCRGVKRDDVSVVRVESLRHEVPPMVFAALPTPSLEALAPFVPHNVMHAIAAGDTTWSAEMRRVTVLFIDVEGLSMAHPDDVTRLNEVLRVLQGAIYRYEGSVNQFLVDDKGMTMLALWGVPLKTFEDDASRAIAAALQAEAALSAMGVRCAAGISVGRVFCGLRGNAQRREYAVIGASVNLAARLVGKAKEVTAS